ncbi:MAG: hypothetical protein AB4426_34395 [Xenococcaceae cyanobacterium]
MVERGNRQQATGNSAPSVDAGGWAQQATGNREREQLTLTPNT